MNFESGLEKFGPPAFWIIFVGGFFIGFIIKSWVLRK